MLRKRDPTIGEHGFLAVANWVLNLRWNNSRLASSHSISIVIISLHERAWEQSVRYEGSAETYQQRNWTYLPDDWVEL